LLEEDLVNHSEDPGDYRFILSGPEEGGELGRRFLGPEFGNPEHRSWEAA
jgi:hypothetical protein